MKRILQVGVPSGLAAGVVMALWSMVATWVTGSGFWTPLNLVAHTFYRSLPLDGTFSVPGLIIGLVVHSAVASAFGIAIVLMAYRLPGRRSLVIAGGIVFVAVVWPAMQWGVWYQLDPAAADGLNQAIFAVAHLLFGMLAAGVASIAVADAEVPPWGRHAAARGTAARGAADTAVPELDEVPGSLFQPDRWR